MVLYRLIIIFFVVYNYSCTWNYFLLFSFSADTPPPLQVMPRGSLGVFRNNKKQMIIKLALSQESWWTRSLARQRLSLCGASKRRNVHRNLCSLDSAVGAVPPPQKVSVIALGNGSSIKPHSQLRQKWHSAELRACVARWRRLMAPPHSLSCTRCHSEKSAAHHSLLRRRYS